MMASEQIPFFDQKIKKIELEATVIRADGTVEHQGVVATYHNDPEMMAEAIRQGQGEIQLCA